MTKASKNIRELQLAIKARESMIKVLNMDGIFLCDVDREEAIRHQAAILQMQEQLNLLLN